MLTNFIRSLAEVVPPPDTRKPLTSETFILNLLPVIITFYATSLLVLLPGTSLLRLALLPCTLWSAFRASTTLDFIKVYNEPSLKYWNQGFCIAMISVCMRAIEWSLRSSPLKRAGPPNSNQTLDDIHETPGLRTAAWDAVDLLFNLRGIGWNWRNGLYIPRRNYVPKSNVVFALNSLIAGIKNAVISDILLYTIQSFSPNTFGSAAGGTIFDPSLPPRIRYTRSSFISGLVCFNLYLAMQAQYDLFCSIGILVFQQRPSDWPPLFDQPWCSTSLTDLWAKRWHQIFRQSFISVGSKPLSVLIGPIGKIFGAFLVSGLLHVLGLWGMGNGTEFWTVGGFFLMMAVGIIGEHIWREITGTRVAGFAGWVWAMSWSLGWSNILVDAWLRKGMAGAIFCPHAWRPATLLAKAISRLLTCVAP